MFTNFYEKLKQFIKENFKSIIFLVILYTLFMWPVNYYIITGGGIMQVGKRIQVEDQYSSKGSLNLAYVSEVKGTIATYMLSYILPDWERLKISSYTYDKDESVEEVEFRGEIDLLTANDNAIKNAYLKAGKTYNVTETNLYVYYVDKDSNNNLKVGDKILEVDGETVSDTTSLRTIISKCEVNQSLNLLIERNSKKKNISVKVYKNEGRNVIGIYAKEIHKYKTDPKVNIKFKKSESGPSGGVIETLDIYNKITKSDVTKGYKIAGTGEIDESGKISTIGGVKYKLLGAEKAGADIFIVPKGDNYKECKKIKEKRNLKIKIIGVSNFDETLEKLKKLKNK